ncbi:MAG: hypothetical protein CMQ29_03775 [Gammaproteobacteria bacterium]|nr:hypothetical protein [Gammaproteobacteria bacterium]
MTEPTSSRCQAQAPSLPQTDRHRCPAYRARSSVPGQTPTVITKRFRYTGNSEEEELLFDFHTNSQDITDLKAANPVALAQMMEQLNDAKRGAAYDPVSSPASA